MTVLLFTKFLATELSVFCFISRQMAHQPEILVPIRYCMHILLAARKNKRNSGSH